MPMHERIMAPMQQVINHALMELRAGAPCDHAIREAAWMGAFVGGGMSASRAVREVERLEPSLIGMYPGERYEGYHPGYVGAGYGKPYGYAPMGQMGKMPFGYGKMMPGRGY